MTAHHSRDVLWFLWQLVRLPVFTVLVVLEPIVRLVLAGIALLAILISMFFEFSGAAPQFPFWGMLGLSLICGLMLLSYYGLIGFLSR